MLVSVELKCRIDDFSFQVYADSDPRFWFRLERTPELDRITDYSLGSSPREQGGPLLARCYETLGLRPRMTVIFQDILCGKNAADLLAKEEAEDAYRAAGSFLLAQFGARQISSSSQQHRGKCDLVLTGQSAA